MPGERPAQPLALALAWQSHARFRTAVERLAVLLVWLRVQPPGGDFPTAAREPRLAFSQTQAAR
jgi:hypothetical protein